MTALKYAVTPSRPWYVHGFGLVATNALLPLPMPTDYDDFSPAARVNAKGTPAEADRNARHLRSAMERRGFIAFPTEWWHFDWNAWESLPVVQEP